MDMASSASSRMRECGTASAEAATAGLNFMSGLDTLENRRSGNGEPGENGGVRQRLIALKSPGSPSSGVVDSHSALPQIHYPDGFAAVREIKFNLVLKTRGRFGGNHFNRYFRRAWNPASAAWSYASREEDAQIRHESVVLVNVIHCFGEQLRRRIPRQPEH